MASTMSLLHDVASASFTGLFDGRYLDPNSLLQGRIPRDCLVVSPKGRTMRLGNHDISGGDSEREWLDARSDKHLKPGQTMKAIKFLLLTFMLAGSAWAAQPAESPLTAGPVTTLNAAAHYVDSIFVHTLASLELIAATPEAKNEDWSGIKPYLKQLDAGLSGIYFFVLPDGNYYSVAMDYTNLNLSDRAYFKSLMAGNQVRGVPIYSRSSGKQSALMAVPIVIDNKVIGALGAAIFLDDLRAKLNRDFALPPGYIWFVLDSDGDTMLHKDGDFIFMNALTQGSESLREALSAALKSESGAMQYVLGGVRHAHYRKLPNMGWLMVLAKIEADEAAAPPQLNLSLDRFVQDLQDRLNQIDASLAKMVAKSHSNIEQEGEVRRLLTTFINENPDVVDASFVDDRGFLRQIEPSEYKNLENADVSKRDHVIAMLNTRMPVFSSGFRAFEGFLAVDLARPLYDGKNNFVGSVSAFIRPELLIDPLLRKSVIPAGYELWIMQPDGLIIFDQDRDEIGRMLFSDPMYADYANLLDLGKQIASKPTGKGSYIFLAAGSREKVIKNMAWQTVRLHGREWRVVLAYKPYE